jgi:hypothetical protein
VILGWLSPERSRRGTLGRSNVKGIGRIIVFDELTSCDLCVDAVYEGGKSGNAGDDPLPRLLELANQGGFRRRGTPDKLEIASVG